MNDTFKAKSWRNVMSSPVFTGCPRCGKEMLDGFAVKTAGLSFVAREKFKSSAFLDEDLSGAGLTKYAPGWKAEYFDSYLCRSCDLYIIDFSTTLSRSEAEQLIKSRLGELQ